MEQSSPFIFNIRNQTQNRWKYNKIKFSYKLSFLSRVNSYMQCRTDTTLTSCLIAHERLIQQINLYSSKLIDSTGSQPVF